MKAYIYAYIYLYLYLWGQYILIITSADNSYSLRMRNSLLRIYIASDKKQIIKEYSNKIINKSKIKFDILYNKIISKFHDINISYYNLSQEEKELLDFIISLNY
jgi:hypothetical protein